MRIETSVEWEPKDADDEAIEIVEEVIAETAQDFVKEVRARLEAQGLKGHSDGNSIVI